MCLKDYGIGIPPERDRPRSTLHMIAVVGGGGGGGSGGGGGRSAPLTADADVAADASCVVLGPNGIDI